MWVYVHLHAVLMLIWIGEKIVSTYLLIIWSCLETNILYCWTFGEDNIFVCSLSVTLLVNALWMKKDVYLIELQ